MASVEELSLSNLSNGYNEKVFSSRQVLLFLSDVDLEQVEMLREFAPTEIDR